MTPEQKLMALMAADTPKQPDPAFEFAVLERVAKQRAVASFIFRLAQIIAGGGVLVACGWALQVGDTASFLAVLAALASMSVAGLVVWVTGRA